MIRALEVLAAGSWSGPPADRATLDQDGRHRRRRAMVGDGGLAFLLDLSEAVRLRHGDGLRLEYGRIVEIRAAKESLLEVRAADPAELLKLAWHVGNRHLAAEIRADHLLIRYDHVIGHMLERLGATVQRIEAPFDPEGGAYEGGSHDQGHSH